jgi:hypothetical protein
MRTSVSILPLVLLTFIVADAQQPSYPKRNGNWWLSLNPNIQTNYMLGAIDGIQPAGWFEIQSMQAEVYEKMQRQIGEALRTISNEDLARNVTALYRDHPEWRDIYVSSAVWLATMRLRGVRAEQIQDAVATIRQHTDR